MPSKMLSKKGVSSNRKREIVTYMQGQRKVSVRQSGTAVGLSRSTYNYKCKPTNDQPIIDALLRLTAKHPAIGFWQCVTTGAGSPFQGRPSPNALNKCGAWILCMTASGMDARFGCSSASDDCNRRLLWIETDASLPAQQVIRELESLKESRGLPEMMQVNSGSGFISRKLDLWCKDHNLTLAFIQPGKTNAKCLHQTA